MRVAKKHAEEIDKLNNRYKDFEKHYSYSIFYTWKLFFKLLYNGTSAFIEKNITNTYWVKPVLEDLLILAEDLIIWA